MKENLIGILAGITFLTAGAIFAFWPEKLQEYSIKTSANAPAWTKYIPFSESHKSKGHILLLRIGGVIAMGIGVFFIMGLFLGTPPN